MAVFTAALLAISTFVGAEQARAAGKKISIPIYNSCASKPPSLFAVRSEQYCILAKPSPQRLKRTEKLSLTSTHSTPRVKQPSNVKVASAQPPPNHTVQTSTTSVPSAAPAEAEHGHSLNADVIFAMINNIRAQHGLSPFEKDENLCGIAQSRAPELQNEIMGSSYMHAGFKARNLPYWATENMIYMNTEEQAVNWWMNSAVHRRAILGDYKYSCGACQGKSC